MNTKITARQKSFLTSYTDTDSGTFGNAYQSALRSGYSEQTARNMTHLAPNWLSENIGKVVIIQPDEIMQQLTSVIQNDSEPTIIRLKAMELSMRAYSMLQQRRDQQPQVVNISVDLSVKEN